jgi:hypothetical protein
VNLTQRLQQLASAGESVLSEATRIAMSDPVEMFALPTQLVKGRDTPVVAFKIGAAGVTGGGPSDGEVSGGGPDAGGPDAGGAPVAGSREGGGGDGTPAAVRGDRLMTTQEDRT